MNKFSRPKSREGDHNPSSNITLENLFRWCDTTKFKNSSSPLFHDEAFYLLNGSDNEKITLTPHEIAILFGFPSDIKQRVSKERDYTPPSNILIDRDHSALIDVNIIDLERERTSILESINSIERKIERAEYEKGKHLKELENLSNLVPSFQSLKEEYFKRLIETDKSIHNSLGIEIEKPEREKVEIGRPYPTRGVATIGILMVLLGSMIFYPVEIPTTLQFVFGIGFLLIGLSVLISSLLHTRNKTTRTNHNGTNSR